ncbi:MAG: EF-hand domain-containing protein [Hydrogenophilales bacterium]|nr:EF-hand domain-containing protein [Hydrogenophilales bacterium]
MRILVWLFSVPLALISEAGSAAPGYSVHDLNRDGYLNRSEYAALRAHCQAHQDVRGRRRCDPTRLLTFELLDADRDGQVGELELLNALGWRHRHGAGWHD